VWVVGHRGFRLVEPENTIASFEAAAAVGTDYMETDIRPTRDGVLILMHDGKVDRTTNGKGLVKDLTFEQLSMHDAGKGNKVPTFEEGLLWAKRKGLMIDVDHKEGAVEDLARVIKDTGMVDRVVIEGPRENLLRFSQLLPGVDTMPKVASVPDITVACNTLHTTVIRLSTEQLTQPDAVAAVHACGARISVTVLGKEDNEEDIRKVIELGAQLIETDHPDIVARLRRTSRYLGER
jgi:glycerophosphoryl diester phosphodiesterase